MVILVNIYFGYSVTQISQISSCEYLRKSRIDVNTIFRLYSNISVVFEHISENYISTIYSRILADMTIISINIFFKNMQMSKILII